MNQAVDHSVPAWVKAVNAVFLLWNLFGLTVFVLAMTVFTSEQALKDAGLSDKQVEVTLATPGWVNVAFGTAVIAGVLGCLCLLLQKKAALPLLIVSLVAVMAQNTYMYLLSDTIEHMGVGASPFVIAVAIFLVPYAFRCLSRDWIR